MILADGLINTSHNNYNYNWSFKQNMNIKLLKKNMIDEFIMMLNDDDSNDKW